MARGLYRPSSVRSTASLVEINPLVVTREQLLALDGKILLDDNAEWPTPSARPTQPGGRRPEGSWTPATPDLPSLRCTGRIGCIVNGAGLAMATMDMVKLAGGQPANFLDVGGSSRPEKVLHAVRIILEDPGITVILLNIFGGITRCDDIARGLLEAKSRGDLTVPVVARLTGTNEPEAKALLEGSGITMAPTMEDAVDLAVRMARGEAVA